MIYKRCSRCHKRIPAGTTCECARNREYTHAEGIKKQYHTERWKQIRRIVMSRYTGIDVYALYKHNRIVYADTVHHIDPTSENPNRFYDLSNLVPVSNDSHKEIHREYKTGEKKVMQEYLRDCMRKFRQQSPGVGEKV